ncbi:MAG: DNA primase noncatalytic subunit PriX [Candidatus Micrarchaeaceae archaeon]
MYTIADLDFAYKYPFTSKAKEIVSESSSNLTSVETKERIIKGAIARVSEAISKGSLEAYRLRLDSAKLDSVMAYPYARMLASSLQRSDLARRYARAEALRCSSFLYLDGQDMLLRISAELGVGVEFDGKEYSIGFTKYLSMAPHENQFKLINQQLSSGKVYMNFQKAAGFMSGPIQSAISNGFPIPKSKIPKEIAEYAKYVRIPKPKLSIDGHSTEWIEDILENPIPDVRQRVVGLILAPYLVNVKKMEIDQAFAIILDYINRCRQLDSSTKITDSQIMYQCKYAKEKGMRPLSFSKAKELLEGIIELRNPEASKESK